MRTSKIFLLIAFVCAGFTAFAQNILTGKIKDTADGSPLPGAIVYIADLKQAAQTDADGNYTMNNLPKGTFLVEVQMLGYSDRAMTVKIDGTTTFNLALSTSEMEEHEVVVTGTSRATSLQHTPQAITEVTKDYLNENSSTNVIDAIAQTPGVSAMTDGQSIAKPVIRGLGYNRVLTINDGVEQVDQPWFDEFGIEADPDAVNRYEILKGPGSLAYGSDAISGVINLIPEQALPNGRTEGEVLANYQTNNGLINNMIHIAGTSNNGISWSGRIDNTMAHAYQDPNDGYVLNSQFSNFNTDGTIGVHRSWGYTQLHASYFSMWTGIVDGTRDSASGKMVQAFSYPDLNGGAPTYEIPTQQELVSYTPLVIYQHIQHTKLVWDNSIAVGNGGSIKAVFSYQKNQRQETNDPTMPNTPDIYYYSDAITYDLRYVTPQIGGFNMSVGTNGATQTSQSLGTLMLIPNYNYLTIGAFAIANERLSDKFYLSGGVRYDTRTFNGIDHYIDSTTQEPAQAGDPNAFHEFQGFTSHFSGMSWSIGATYDITKSIYVKGNIAQGWRAPNVAECGANGVHDGTVVYEIGDPTLKPETNIEEDFTFGINSKDVTLELNVFNNSITDYIYAKGLMSMIPGAGDSINNSLNAVGLGAAPVYKYSQTAATLNGGEAAIDIHPASMSWVDLDLSYSMVNGQLNGISDSTKYLPFVPPNRFIADLKFHIKKIGKGIKDAYIKFGMQNYSEQSKVYEQYAIYSGLNTAVTPFEYAASTTATKGYTLFSAGVGGNIISNGHKFCELYIVCNNLTNLGYMDYMSRFKYLPVNYTTDKVGVFNMGRNISFKLIIPFNLSKKAAPEEKE